MRAEQRDDGSRGQQESISEHVSRNVQVVTEMHLQAERAINRDQRAIEAVTGLFGRPVSLYLIVGVVSAWMAGNTIGGRLGMPVPDPPPYPFLQGAVGLSALLMTTMVLITQNRQAKLSERRMHLDLQVNLLTEQKTAKIIELVEELRRDLPDVRDRHDVEAEVMQRAAEPQKLIAVLEEQAIGGSRTASERDETDPGARGDTGRQ